MAPSAMPATYTDAINLAMAAAPEPRTATGFPRLTNQQASGLIMFAKALQDHASSQGNPFAFDWYAYALAALGFTKPGDKFVMTAAQQATPYARTNELWHELITIAAHLDAAKIPFWLPRDPTGTERTYKTLAQQAWEEMKAKHPSDAKKSSGGKTPTKMPTTTTPPPLRDDGDTYDGGDVHAKRAPSNTTPGPVEDPTPPTTESGGAGGILLLGLLLWALDD